MIKKRTPDRRLKWHEHTGEICKIVCASELRSELESVDELVAAGSMDPLRAAGKLRVEGREYRVQDGDVIFFRIGKTN